MQPIEELRYLILAAQREGNRSLTGTLRPLGLTPSQAEVVRVLQDHQPLSLVALGDLLVCETGSPSRLVNGLVEAGLIERIPSTVNGRMVTLTLTPDGKEKADQVRAIEEAMYQALSHGLQGVSLSEINELLWRYIHGTRSGAALAKRAERTQSKSISR